MLADDYNGKGRELPIVMTSLAQRHYDTTYKIKKDKTIKELCHTPKITLKKFDLLVLAVMPLQ